MTKYTGQYLLTELCKAVGINPEATYKIVVEGEVGGIVEVITHGFVETDEGKIDRLKEVIQHYELKPEES